MAIKVIKPDELREMEQDEYVKEAQNMLAKIAKTQNEDMGFVFIDDYKFDKEDKDKDGDLEDQTVFIAGTDFDAFWKSSDINALRKDGYKQDLMYGKCRHDQGVLHLLDIEGGSILSKNLDLKFNYYLKDMQKKNIFKGWKFHFEGMETSGPKSIQEVESSTDSSEGLFGNDVEKEAANEERIRLVKEIPILLDELEDAYKKAEIDETRETLEELLDATREIRSDLIDIFKFYLSVTKAAVRK